MKTQRQIWTDAIEIINTGLNACDISGYTVKRSNQANLSTRINGLILLDLIDAIHYGWQGHTDFVQDGSMKHKEELIVTYQFQVTVLRKLQADDTIPHAEDVTETLAMWLQSERAIRLAKSKGYGLYRVQQINQPHSDNDSDQYEVTPAFEFWFETVQELLFDQNAIDGFISDVKGV